MSMLKCRLNNKEVVGFFILSFYNWISHNWANLELYLYYYYYFLYCFWFCLWYLLRINI